MLASSTVPPVTGLVTSIEVFSARVNPAFLA